MKLFIMCVRENLQQKPPPFQKGGTANMRAFVSAKCAVNDFFKKSFKKTDNFQVLRRKKS